MVGEAEVNSEGRGDQGGDLSPGETRKTPPQVKPRTKKYADEEEKEVEEGEAVAELPRREAKRQPEVVKSTKQFISIHATSIFNY